MTILTEVPSGKVISFASDTWSWTSFKIASAMPEIARQERRKSKA